MSQYPCKGQSKEQLLLVMSDSNKKADSGCKRGPLLILHDVIQGG